MGRWDPSIDFFFFLTTFIDILEDTGLGIGIHSTCGGSPYHRLPSYKVIVVIVLTELGEAKRKGSSQSN